VWTDTPNEESYVLYRLDPGAARFHVIASGLRANTTRYRDTITAGGYYGYMVAAVRSGVEGRSAPFGVTIPERCFPPSSPSGTTDLVLTVASLDTTETFTGVYCYYSIDGTAFDRLPAREPDTIRGPDERKQGILRRERAAFPQGCSVWWGRD